MSTPTIGRSARGVIAVAVTLTVLTAPRAADAQGVSAAGVRGTITSNTGAPIDARVRITRDATGFSVDVRASAGQFLIQGLEPGGPYTVEARALGFTPERRAGVVLSLGELREIDVALEPLAARLDTVTIAADDGTRGRAHADGGTGTTITESMIDRLPTPNRDLHDFVRLVPQVSTKVSLPNPGLSAGGVGFRFNNFLVNGVSERTLSGSVSNAFAGSKSIPLGAVQEYQVLLAPYDVRYGDFAGALVNAVTKSGTNTFQGSVFAYARSNRLARRVAGDSTPPYQKTQYGFSLGGPIIRNRLHFFVAPELQHFTYPASGPYMGQPTGAARPVPVSAADLARFETIMRGLGLTAGSAGPIENGNPLRNLFTRFDLGVPELRSRLIVWDNYNASEDLAFSRDARDVFSLSSYQVTRLAQGRATAIHVHTTMERSGGGHNELLVARRSEGIRSRGPVDQPIVRVRVPGVSGGMITLNSGTDETAHGSLFRSSGVSIKDNLTLPFGASHVVTIGAELERFQIRREGVNNSYGTWIFSSLDSLALGAPVQYNLGVDLGNSAPLRGTQYTAFAGDRWQMTDRLLLTGGVRADLLAIEGHAPYHPLVDSLFGRRTDEMPRPRVELSPRVGFIWDIAGTGQHHLRGGAGVFTGRYPLAWAHSALTSYGLGGGQLTCSYGGAVERYPPAFTSNHDSPPNTCGGGYSFAPLTDRDVDLLDRNLRMMRVARGSLAYERRLPWNVVLTGEALVTRALSDFVLVNLNLAGPERTDRYGRVMYGTFTANGAARPTRPSDSAFVGVAVTDLRNTSRNYSYQISTGLATTQRSGTSGSVSYTFSRTRDVQTPLRVNNRGIVTWGSARVTGGRHDDLTSSISSNDLPHRVIVAGTWVAPWRRARSEVSFYYIGESGRPFTYTAFGGPNFGDLNADGSNVNDPIYVPRSALDTMEIQFTGISDGDTSLAARTSLERQQQDVFERFIERTSCLRRQRGAIMARNSCREPWSNLTIASIRQFVPVMQHGLELQLDVFNVLNLLNAGWGLRREATPLLLEHVGRTSGPVESARPVFRFIADAPTWTLHPDESAFQLQIAARYRF